MTATFFPRAVRTGASGLALCALLWHGTVAAAPGAHGPGGEHLDGAGHGHSAVSDAPRVEAHSELFELVATLAGGELSILVDRFATNEPVLGATVEVELQAGAGAGASTGTLKASAKFHADHGDYAVADEAFLKALSAPGGHALVFTVTAGAEADLLDGVLPVGTAPSDPHDGAHAPARPWLWVLGGAAVLLTGGAVRYVRRRPSAVPESAA